MGSLPLQRAEEKQLSAATVTGESRDSDRDPPAKPSIARRLRFQCVYRYAEGFSLDLHFQTANRITALYGPSGSGKTTVLKLISGLLRPDAGRIALDEQVLVDVQQGRFLPPEQRSIGMLFQEQCLFPHMTVKANLLYGRRRRGTGPSVQQIVDAFELDHLQTRYPRRLSGGEQQRVALARAVLSGPQLLLLDEPLTAVQPRLREQIVAMLQNVIAQLELTTLVVSHDVRLVERLADDIISLDAGRVAE